MSVELSKASGRRRSLSVATSNGNLLRLFQGLAHSQGWKLATYLTGAQAIEGAAAEPPDLFAADVFLDDVNGLDLRSYLRAQPPTLLTPITLVAPGCHSAAELCDRLDVAPNRLTTLLVDEPGLALRIRDLMDALSEPSLLGVSLRFEAFIQTVGESCHAANQPLTSLICNLELALHQIEGHPVESRLRSGHESALKIAKIIRRLQETKWIEEKQFAQPVHLLVRNAAEAADGSGA